MPGNLHKSALLSSRPRRRKDQESRGTRGFTLLEMIIVISIMAIFMAIALPTYNHSILRARESVLQSDLDTLNDAIVKYTLDKQKAPQSLDDLKGSGYIEKIPDDPMTNGGPDWEVEQDDTSLLSLDQQDPGITGVHCASNAIGSNGTAYSTW
jgi:general secretion pathway protein G